MTYPIETFLAFLYTALFLTIGVSFLNNKKFYEALTNDFSKIAGLTYIGGILAFGFGLFTIIYNTTTPYFSSALFIEIFGWLTLLKGLFRLLTPTLAQRLTHSHAKRVLPYAGWISLIVGIVMVLLLYFVG